MKANPKYPLDPDFRREVERRERAEQRTRTHGEKRVPLAVEGLLEGTRYARRLTVGSGGRALAYWLPDRRELTLYLRDPPTLDPTVAYWLLGMLREMPEWADVPLSNFEGTYGDGTVRGEPLGITLGDVKDATVEVTETGLESPFYEGEEEVLRTWKYRAVPFETRVWYHATLAYRVPSILEQGLLPSGLGQERTEGWSPGWNWNLQRAVYLFSSPERAFRVAATLALRNEKDASIVQVTGKWVEDTRFLVPDEDALRDPHDGSVMYSDLDTDFPPWVTSQESKTRSIAYRGIIRPEFITPWATLLYSQTEIEFNGEKEIDEEIDVETESELARETWRAIADDL